MTVKRICCICGKRTRKAPDGSDETTVGFHTTLHELGIAGDKAHPSCIKDRTRIGVEPYRKLQAV